MKYLFIIFNTKRIKSNYVTLKNVLEIFLKKNPFILLLRCLQKLVVISIKVITNFQKIVKNCPKMSSFHKIIAVFGVVVVVIIIHIIINY